MDYNQFDSFVEDFLGEKNDRPVIIIAASKIDDLLFRILEKFFLPKSSKGSEQDELLEGDNPISTFSSRIKLTYRLGIVDHDLFKILEKIRTIRNKSAHSIEFDTKKSPIREHLVELKRLIINRDSYHKTSTRYFSGMKLTGTVELQCMMVTICVLLQSIQEKITKTKGFDKTLLISKK